MGVYLPLPSAYQQVEYIQSSWTQYIILWNQFKTSYKVVIDLQMTVIWGDYIPLWVHNNDWVNNIKYWIDAYSSKFHLNAGGEWTATMTEDTNRHTIIIDKSTANIDGTDYTIPYTNYTFNDWIWVFCYYEIHQTSKYNFKSSNKLYKLDIYDENWIHIHEAIPCYRKSDNVIWLYDLVSDTFYTNSWTWTFTKWADVYMSELKNAYIGEVWTPWADTIAYWTFDDQSTTQMTDVTWNWNNIPLVSWSTAPTYTLLDWTDYYATFSNNRFNSSSLPSAWSSFSCVFWVKIADTSKMYLVAIWINSPNVAVIYWFNSWQIELYSYINPTTYRTTIKSSTPQNTWMCIWFVRHTNSVDTYYNWQLVNSGVTWWSSNNDWAYFWWSSNERLKWSQNNIILESRLWTAQDMADYYNLTKSNYWL